MSEVFDDPQDGHVNPDDLPAGDPADLPTPDPETEAGVPVGPGTDTTGIQVAA
jgi:hypothetical protein